MARVVQRRSNPPYLLILFVFLFLAATIGLVVVYLNSGKLNQQVASLQDTNAKQTDSVAKLTKQSADLAEAIGSRDPAQALKEWNALKEKSANQQLPFAVSSLLADVQKQGADRKKAEEERDAALKQLETEKAAMAAQSAAAIDQAQKEYSKKAAEIERDFKEALKKAQESEAALIASIESAKDTQRKEVEALQQALAIKTDEVGKKNIDVAKLDARVAQLLDELRKYRPSLDPDKMGSMPKGKIAQTSVDGKTVFINKGSRDGVTTGLTFSVFSPGAKTNKADIQVTTVRENISEAKITQAKPNDPVLRNDDIANPAFNPGRSYTYVVRGNFDLDGKGKPTPGSTEMVKEIIRKAGGKVVEDITVTTDWLVLGQAPEMPQPLAEGFTPSEERLFEDQKRIVDDYNRVKDTATKLGILILNDNKFVAWIGFGLEKPQQ